MLGDLIIVLSNNVLLVYKVEDIQEGYPCRYCAHKLKCSKSMCFIKDKSIDKFDRLFTCLFRLNLMESMACIKLIYRSKSSLFSISYVINKLNLKDAINYECKRINE